MYVWYFKSYGDIVNSEYHFLLQSHLNLFFGIFSINNCLFVKLSSNNVCKVKTYTLFFILSETCKNKIKYMPMGNHLLSSLNPSDSLK